MKNIVLILMLSFNYVINAQTATIKVEMSGFKNNKGQVMIGLYNSEGKFLKELVNGRISKIANNQSVAIFKDIPKGEYAVAIFHDENSNGKMDTNFIGIPKEDFAASNNAKGFMGPPKYKDAKFNLNQDKTISIKIN